MNKKHWTLGLVFESRVKKLKVQNNRLVSRNSEYIIALNVEKAQSASPIDSNIAFQTMPITPVVRIKPTSLPKFSVSKEISSAGRRIGKVCRNKENQLDQ